MKRTLFLAVLTVLLFAPFLAKHHRNATVGRHFEKSHPCPSTSKDSGPCPGYVKDHILALCAGGTDTIGNLQWQTLAQAREKDRAECRR